MAEPVIDRELAVIGKTYKELTILDVRLISCLSGFFKSPILIISSKMNVTLEECSIKRGLACVLALDILMFDLSAKGRLTFVLVLEMSVFELSVCDELFFE
ncbi:hypothetical protein DPMN_125301 [Dreissena polymorpha]|uniref:Uncharacterized protein n=1 Tax=Dreissena polymorpha TaxID=45954 RepID=A0A9D4GXX8_DREPO|nr:hypothetical protein DPMN_125301 [Dreissena polymorpha]